MSAPRTDMHRLQELVRLFRMGIGVRERARLLGMSTRTEREYREAIALAGLLEGSPAEPPEAAELRAAVEAAKPLPAPREVPSSIEPWLAEIRKATEGGVGPQAIWDRLRRKDPAFTASVSAVKRAVRRIRREQGVRAKDVVIPVETEAGDVAQVDFGYAGRLFDPDTGLVRKAWVFVMVLGFSRHLFAKIVFDQKSETWLALHAEAFRWFGGVPKTLVPDNLKAAVVRAAFGAGDRHEVALNRGYREMARYCGCKIDPTPVRSPQKKGKVESAVKYVCRNFLAAGAFENIQDAIDHSPVVMPRPTSSPGLVRQQRFQHCPFLVTQVSSSHGRPLWRTHRILGTRPRFGDVCRVHHPADLDLLNRGYFRTPPPSCAGPTIWAPLGARQDRPL